MWFRRGNKTLEAATRISILLLYIIDGIIATYYIKCNLSIKHLCYLTGDLARTIDGRFYGKFVDVQGIPVLSSHQVSDLTLASYGYLLDIVISHLSSDVRSSLVRRGFRFAIVGQSESFCDIPEIAINYYIAPMKPCSRPGIQGVTFKTMIVVSEGQGLQACDGFHNSSKTGRVLIHELTHAINLVIDDELEYLKNTLDSAYLNALANNLLDNIKDQSRAHYFTWGFMTYINANECNPNSYVYRDRLCTKQDLRQYDVYLYQLIESVVQNLDWAYSCDDVCNRDQIYKYPCFNLPQQNTSTTFLDVDETLTSELEQTTSNFRLEQVTPIVDHSSVMPGETITSASRGSQLQTYTIARTTMYPNAEQSSRCPPTSCGGCEKSVGAFNVCYSETWKSKQTAMNSSTYCRPPYKDPDMTKITFTGERYCKELFVGQAFCNFKCKNFESTSDITECQNDRPLKEVQCSTFRQVEDGKTPERLFFTCTCVYSGPGKTSCKTKEYQWTDAESLFNEHCSNETSSSSQLTSKSADVSGGSGSNSSVNIKTYAKEVALRDGRTMVSNKTTVYNNTIIYVMMPHGGKMGSRKIIVDAKSFNKSDELSPLLLEPIENLQRFNVNEETTAPTTTTGGETTTDTSSMSTVAFPQPATDFAV